MQHGDAYGTVKYLHRRARAHAGIESRADILYPSRAVIVCGKIGSFISTRERRDASPSPCVVRLCEERASSLHRYAGCTRSHAYAGACRDISNMHMRLLMPVGEAQRATSPRPCGYSYRTPLPPPPVSQICPRGKGVTDTARKIVFPEYCRYRITPERYSEQLGVADVDDDYDAVPSTNFRPLSTEATDLRMGVASFCKAFPWHFVVDRQLELVQLGVGFMRIFGHHLNRLGREISTYFVFTRPHGVTLTFHEILKRANTPFILTLQRPHGVDKYPAEVCSRCGYARRAR